MLLLCYSLHRRSKLWKGWCNQLSLFTILGSFLIGPFIVLPPRQNSENYLIFLQNNFPDLLEDIPLATRHYMWFMHNGAPPHFSITIRHLDMTYSNRWIDWRRPIPWPPKSPDHKCSMYGDHQFLKYKNALEWESTHTEQLLIDHTTTHGWDSRRAPDSSKESQFFS